MKPHRPVRQAATVEPRRGWRFAGAGAVLGVATSLLALIVSAMAYWLALSERDTPFATIVYQRQLERVFDAVDFIGRIRYTITDLETRFDLDLVTPDQATREVDVMVNRWGEIVSQDWVYPLPVRRAVATAAGDFNAFASLCLRGRYARPDAIGRVGSRRFAFDAACQARFETHQASATAAEQALTGYIGFDERSTRIGQRLGHRLAVTAPGQSR